MPTSTPSHLRLLIILVLFASIIGFADAFFLTIEHLRSNTPGCSIVFGCDRVLTSEYSELFHLPLALFGALYYITVFLLSLLALNLRRLTVWLSALSVLGFLMSLYLLYVQSAVLVALCTYCILSALISSFIFILGLAIHHENANVQSTN